ncbi:hypothetical protein Bbelb_064200 [Branchiostoma belcheri]|nr:hypothetical protein Bbelb_064200 [Branchiostoma belcheri]
MEWQGSKYGFLHIPDCWSRLSGSDSLPQSWIAWRKDYPVKVAVIDSGIKRDHQAFAHIPGAEIQGKNFISPDDNIDDDDSNEKGHGTKCAAIIAGGCYKAEKYEKEEKKSAAPFKFWNGVAPFVNLYICKTELIVDAINHLVEEKKNNGLQKRHVRSIASRPAQSKRTDGDPPTGWASRFQTQMLRPRDFDRLTIVAIIRLSPTRGIVFFSSRFQSKTTFFSSDIEN